MMCMQAFAAAKNKRNRAEPLVGVAEQAIILIANAGVSRSLPITLVRAMRHHTRCGRGGIRGPRQIKNITSMSVPQDLAWQQTAAKVTIHRMPLLFHLLGPVFASLLACAPVRTRAGLAARAGYPCARVVKRPREKFLGQLVRTLPVPIASQKSPQA